MRELDRIGEQVVKDLLDLARITEELAQLLRGNHLQPDMPVDSLLPDDRQAVLQ
jgi:hypothetical protein